MDVAVFLSAITLSAGYNTAVVSLGAAFLGLAGSMVGTFLLLRRRTLVSDAMSHATLPGIGIAFLVMAVLGGTGRFLPGLLVGAALAAGLGLYAVEWLTRRTRLQPDAAIGAVLSSFFGFGVVMLTVIQSLQIGRQAGLSNFLLGSTSGMLRADAITLSVLALGCAGAMFVLRRPLTLIAFDQTFAQAAGLDIRRYDLLLMMLALAVTVTGLPMVGLVLVIAVLIIPPVAARFWTDRVSVMVLISGAVGALSGFVGAALSASVPDLPTCPVIVLVATAIFACSMLAAPRRGLIWQWRDRRAGPMRVERP
jgi:manganese/zinc/iron transport system permease protein